MAPKSEPPRPEPVERVPERAPERGSERASEREPAAYEFSEAHKDSFRALAASVSFVGVCTLLFAVLAAIFTLGEIYMGFLPSGLGTGAAAGVSGIMGWWMVSAGRSLSAMLRTRRKDVDYLMEAVVHLRRFFGLARVVVIALAMLVTIGGAAVVWCNLVVERGGRCFGGLG